MLEIEILNRAKWLSYLVHEGETRRNGEPYRNHCDRVVESLKDKSVIIQSAAQCHDIFENAKNPEFVRRMTNEFLPLEVVYLIEILTNDKNIYYSHYINVVCNNKDALEVKFQDLIDNTIDINLPTYPEKQRVKYKEAILLIKSKGIEIPQILKERFKIGD